MNKQKIIVANFKMNLTLKFELNHWLDDFSQKIKTINFSQTDLVLCPPIIHLQTFIDRVKNNSSIAIGGQDCFWERKGSYTGAVSPASIYSLGGRYVILGHSERKKYFGETAPIINLKLKASSKVGLKSIVCVGETAEEKQKDLTSQIINQQLDNYLKDFPLGQLDRLLICYEPVWAISSNNPTNPPTVDEIMTAKLIIKKKIVEKYGAKAGDKIRILYGGSVNQGNVEEVCLEAGMDGVLVGKASLVPNEILGMVKKIS